MFVVVAEMVCDEKQDFDGLRSMAKSLYLGMVVDSVGRKVPLLLISLSISHSTSGEFRNQTLSLSLESCPLSFSSFLHHFLKSLAFWSFVYHRFWDIQPPFSIL